MAGQMRLDERAVVAYGIGQGGDFDAARQGARSSAFRRFHASKPANIGKLGRITAVYKNQLADRLIAKAGAGGGCCNGSVIVWRDFSAGRLKNGFGDGADARMPPFFGVGLRESDS